MAVGAREDSTLDAVARDDVGDSAPTDDLIAQMVELQACALSILRRADSTGRTEVALKVMREVRSNMELLARLTGQLDQPAATTAAVVVIPGPPIHSGGQWEKPPTLIAIEHRE